MYRIGGHLTWPSPWKHVVNIFAKLGLSVSESDNVGFSRFCSFCSHENRGG
jgi:hypothetical protein